MSIAKPIELLTYITTLLARGSHAIPMDYNANKNDLVFEQDSNAFMQVEFVCEEQT